MYDNEQKIDLNRDFTRGVDVPKEDHKSFPFRPEVKEPRIYIDKKAYDDMQAHAAESTNVELCGVLVGKMYADESGNFLHIIGAIRGEYARNQGTNVSFTPETWDYINEQREKLYPDYKVIGWYHTHPGFTVFFSGMDKFIQDYFFNDPYYIAVVIDPKIDSTGCFAWIDGKLKGISKWWVGDKEVELTVGPVGNDLTEQDINNAQDIEQEEKISEDFIEIYEKYKNEGVEAISNFKDILSANGGAPIVIGVTMFFFGLLLSSWFNSHSIKEAYSRSFHAENRENITNLINDMRTREDFYDLSEKIKDLRRIVVVDATNGNNPLEKDLLSDKDLLRIGSNLPENSSVAASTVLKNLSDLQTICDNYYNSAKSRSEKIKAFLNKHQTASEKISQSDDDIQYIRNVIGKKLEEESIHYMNIMLAGKAANEDRYISAINAAQYAQAMNPYPSEEFNDKLKELKNAYIQFLESKSEAGQQALEVNKDNLYGTPDTKDENENESVGQSENNANAEAKAENSQEQSVAANEEQKSQEQQPASVNEEQTVQENTTEQQAKPEN